MIEFVFYIIVVALLAAFLIGLMRKLGVVEYVQVHGNKLFSEMFSCDFCLSWWSCVAVALFAFIICGNPVLFGVPFCATMITRVLL